MRLFVRVLVLLSLLLLSSSALFANTVQQQGYQYQQAPTPDWVASLPHDLGALEPTKQTAGINYLVVDEQLSLRQGQYLAYTHIAMQVNTPQGLEQASTFNFHFSPDYQQLQVHAITLTRDNQQYDILAAADIRLAQRERETDQGIYNGIVTAMVLLSDIRVGDRIDYAYSVQGTNPIYQGKRSAYYALNWAVPVHYARVRILTDQTTTLYHQSNLPTLHLTPHTTDSGSVYEWQQQAIAAVIDEDDYPDWHTPYAYLEVSEFANWQEVVEWALPMYQFSEPLVPELKLLADSWLAQAKSSAEYAAMVVRYVQNNIRYFGIEIGLNSHQPHAPNQVFERKFGDCKDKTTLMLTLLRYGGLEAYPALVSHRWKKGIATRLPNPGVFDHVITYLNLDGQAYWLDGTRSQQYGPLAEKGQQYFQQALVIKQNNGVLSDIDAPQSKQNTFRTDEVLTLAAVDEPVSLNLQLALTGESAERFRRMLDTKGITDYSAELEQAYRRQYPSADLQQPITVLDDIERNKLQIHANFVIAQFWDPESERQKLMLYGDSIDSYAQMPSTTRRNSPLAIPPGVHYEHNIQYKLASNINWSLDDLALHIENKAIAYRRTITAEPLSIKVLHQYYTKADHVTAAETTSYIQQLRKLREALYYSVEIDKSSNADNSTDTEQALRQRFRQLLNKKGE